MEMKKIKIKKIKNLTPHEVTLVGEDGKVIATFPSEGLLRLSQKTERVGTISVGDGVEIPITETTFGGIEALPPREEGTIYIVSALTCQAAPDRDDFYIPNQTVRDENGRIIGCRSLSRNPWFRGSYEGGDEQ
ncbi:MAG: hypothetical protein DRN30_01515 [Thermoplasmata archaeon]|nr:MAG: hypothetical protein DRN30_01515 [Thermoplasmata archaeon]